MKRILAFVKKIFLSNGRLRPCLLPMVLLAGAVVLLSWGGVRLTKAFEYNRVEISEEPEDLGISEIKMDLPDGITNIALFGIDAREEDFRGLSDSIMIITIDAEHNDIKLTSILRDSLVEIEGYGYQKINAAYNLGGAELAIKTLNQTFDLNIRDYATVDFVSMAEIIDFVGGIEAELTEGEVRNGNIHIRSMNAERGTPLDYFEEAGLQTLTGTQAVAFARIRKAATVDGAVDDAGRTVRQRLVMHQLFEKALAMDIAKYPAMIRSMLPCMETSLSYAEIFNLAGLLTNPGLTFKEGRIPTNEALIAYGLNVKGLGSCKYYNLDYAAKLLNAFIFEDISFEDYMEENGVDRTPWFYGELADEEETEDEPPEGEEELPDEEVDGEEELPDTEPEDTTLPEGDTEDAPTEEQPETPDAETPDQPADTPAETPDQSTDSEQTETPPETDVTDPAEPTV